MNKKAGSNKKFAALTDNDLMYERGNRQEMLGKLKIKLGKTKKNCTKLLINLFGQTAW